jgi:WD40 repeat protein
MMSIQNPDLGEPLLREETNANVHSMRSGYLGSDRNTK